MLTLGALAFLAPWVLLGLGAVPLLWWLLRVVPPAPLRVRFPAIRLLFGLVAQQEAAVKTPWWLVALRLALACAAIVALAHPVWEPAVPVAGSGPLILVLDDGWAAARDWEARRAAADRVLAQAERAGRPVLLVTTAPSDRDGRVPGAEVRPAAEASTIVHALRPKPWGTDRTAALAAFEAARPETGTSIWIADGVADAGAPLLAEALLSVGSLEVRIASQDDGPLVLMPPGTRSRLLEVGARRIAGDGPRAAWVRASGEDGRLLARGELVFDPGEDRAAVALDLPGEVRNLITRLDIEGERGAGATVLLDDRWRRRPVGLVSGGSLERDQPLLSDVFYVERALEPFTELRRGEIGALLANPPSVIVLADVAKIPAADLEALEPWIADGGVLLRFAGPRFAEGADELVPVRLRGGRTIGGAMSWAEPARLAPFDSSSPFAGLAIPRDVLVARQVLAEPTLDLPGKTWARLTDGTPLVTGEPRGKGWLVLVHTTANTAWSNLAISGLFVELLQRLVELSAGVPTDESEAALPPWRSLDGFGVLGPPPPAARAVPLATIDAEPPGPTRPPGYYGPAEAPRALNLGPSLAEATGLGPWPADAVVSPFGTTDEIDVQPWLVIAAILLALAELVASLAARGQILRPRPVAAAAVVLALVGATPPVGAVDDAFVIEATQDLRLAYVRTGDADVDDLTRAGLWGLGTILRARTSVEPGEPMAIDLENDELLFFPLVYWAITPDQPRPSDGARAKIDRYLKTGGILVLDTRDPDAAMGGGGASAATLRRLLRGLSIPPLVPVPHDHVLTRSFYLLDEFPGRWTGGQVWIEQTDGGVNDGVSSILVGSHDWAAAWAMDTRLQPLLPVVPGGERQREIAYRFGINLVMYATTGNYKADAVHVPTILERLGE
ncbi:MAG: DUF4159 domain-containing protein [Alphaproteobacteria bacterium]